MRAIFTNTIFSNRFNYISYFNIERLSATDKKNIPIITNIRLKTGEIACYMSHIRCWKKLINSDEDCMLILEDDAIPINQNRLLPNLLPKCDIIFLNNRFKNVNGKLVGWGTESYIITKSGAKKMLSHVNKRHFNKPVDKDLQNLCNIGYLFCFVPDNPFFKVSNAKSTIR